jgi:NADPH:quinone reductase-like Zn-dependent oxidoreductase
VTAVCASEHLELVRGLGADRVIDYTAGDFTKDEQCYDVVLDAVGKSSFGRTKRLLKPRGIYLSSDLGPLSRTRSWRSSRRSLAALRHQAWGAASQSCGSVSLPPDAAMQQQP